MRSSVVQSYPFLSLASLASSFPSVGDVSSWLQVPRFHSFRRSRQIDTLRTKTGRFRFAVGGDLTARRSQRRFDLFAGKVQFAHSVRQRDGSSSCSFVAFAATKIPLSLRRPPAAAAGRRLSSLNIALACSLTRSSIPVSSFTILKRTRLRPSASLARSLICFASLTEYNMPATAWPVQLEDQRTHYASQPDTAFPWVVHAYNPQHGMMHCYGFHNAGDLDPNAEYYLHVPRRTNWAPGHEAIPTDGRVELRRADHTAGALLLPVVPDCVSSEISSGQSARQCFP